MRFKNLSAVSVLTLIFVFTPRVLVAAEYEITFTGTWNESDVEPGRFPSFSAHFSPMIGASHKAGEAFWRNGGQASPGVEQVAELGLNDALISELAAARSAGNVGQTIEFRDLFNLPNSDTVKVTIDEDKPYVTFITMIAPSPDWFVGVSGLSLLEDGEWVRNLKVNLRPYDAGTEEGTSFTLFNDDSPASDTIFRLTGDDSPFIGRPIIGTLEFKLMGSTEPLDSQISQALPAITGLLLEE